MSSLILRPISKIPQKQNDISCTWADTLTMQGSTWSGRGSFLDFCSNLHKIVVIHSSVSRTTLIRRALESSDPGTSNGGLNFSFRHFGVDMAAFEVGDSESRI